MAKKKPKTDEVAWQIRTAGSWNRGWKRTKPLNWQVKILFSTLTLLNNDPFEETELGCTEQDVSVCTAICRLCDRVFRRWCLWRKLNLRRKNLKRNGPWLCSELGRFSAHLSKFASKEQHVYEYSRAHTEIHLWEVRMSEVQEFIPTGAVWVLQEEKKVEKFLLSFNFFTLLQQSSFPFGFWPSSPTPPHPTPPPP